MNQPTIEYWKACATAAQNGQKTAEEYAKTWKEQYLASEKRAEDLEDDLRLVSGIAEEWMIISSVLALLLALTIILYLFT